ncbi:MAG: hypothetical protein IJZ72_04260 [Oscillospiraceae bacterium]|nr:hypothetical protein [Oscillospiraceae bacterium]
MNYKLLQDIEIAYGKLKKINEANIKIMELNKRKNQINEKYDRDKAGIFISTLADIAVIVTNLFILVITVLGGFIAALWLEAFFKVSADFAPLYVLIGLISFLFIKNIFLCKRRKLKNEKWWKTEAQAELQQIDNTINKLKQLISSTMNNDYVLSNIRSGLRNEEALAGLYNIVKSNYADDIKTAQSIWIDQEYYRLQRENAERAAREKEQQLAALNGRLDEINSHLENIELMEELKYWERASRR